MIGSLRISPLGLILAAVFVDLLGYGIIIPLLPILIERLGGGATLVGLLAALYALTQGICGPILAALSDRYGRRPILLICLLGTGCSYLLLGTATSLPILAAAIMLDALTGANLSTAQAYVGDTVAPEQRAHSFGLLAVAFGLGVTAGPTLSGLLSRIDAHIPALVAGGMTFLNLGLMLIFLPESLPTERRAHTIPHPFGALTTANLPGGLRPLLLMVGLINLAFAGLQSNFPIFSRARFGWDASANAYFFGFVGLCAVLTQALLLGRLRQRYQEPQLIQIGALCMTLGLPLLGFANLAWILYPIAALVTIGSSICIPSLASQLATQYAERKLGQIMGTQQFVINLAMTAGPLLAGLAYDTFGQAAPYLAGGVYAFLALLLSRQALATPARHT